jgi:hypothetical protein
LILVHPLSFDFALILSPLSIDNIGFAHMRMTAIGVAALFLARLASYPAKAEVRFR